jgi:hypothetical protein
MRYFSSPSGAVVQSYGRLGTILFEPGDVIMAIGGFPATESTSLDQIINNGYLTSQRSVIVRDRNTGRVVNLFY